MNDWTGNKKQRSQLLAQVRTLKLSERKTIFMLRHQ